MFNFCETIHFDGSTVGRDLKMNFFFCLIWKYFFNILFCNGFVLPCLKRVFLRVFYPAIKINKQKIMNHQVCSGSQTLNSNYKIFRWWVICFSRLNAGNGHKRAQIDGKKQHWHWGKSKQKKIARRDENTWTKMCIKLTALRSIGALHWFAIY